MLFLARLASMDEQLYEAAMIDRANWWKRSWHIALPQVARVIELVVVIGLIDMLSWVFSYVYVMTTAAPSRRHTSRSCTSTRTPSGTG